MPPKHLILHYVKLRFHENVYFEAFPGDSAGKESTCHAGNLGLIPGLGRSPGEENNYPLNYSGLDDFMGCGEHD